MQKEVEAYAERTCGEGCTSRKKQNSRNRSISVRLERVVLLKVIDSKWMDHIDDMDQLRQGIGLAGIWPERSEG